MKLPLTALIFAGLLFESTPAAWNPRPYDQHPS